jgi:CRP-like cAMP-binding protein
VERLASPNGWEDGGRHNKVLDALEAATRKRISPHLQVVMFKLGSVVYEAGTALEYAYFPAGSVLSLLTVLENGSAIETANIGSEGAFGLFAALSSHVLESAVRCVIQLPGLLFRCPIDALRDEVARSEALRDHCAGNSESILTQVQQNVVCNARHSTRERLCRWLLTSDDRAGARSSAYPYKFLADILGENGQSVTLAAQLLHTDGLVTCRRATIQIVDRPGIEEASCECYAIAKKRIDRDLPWR